MDFMTPMDHFTPINNLLLSCNQTFTKSLRGAQRRGNPGWRLPHFVRNDFV